MNTGQMMLTLGAMILLSFLILRVNGSQLTTQESMQTSKFGILGISIASSIIESASEKSFDEKSIQNFVSKLSDITSTNKFGVESGENSDSINTFDDFDDFHNYSYIDSTMPSAVYNVSCKVNYVSPNTSGFITKNKTWHKLLTVTVSSVSMRDTIKMSKVFSYWKLP